MTPTVYKVWRVSRASKEALRVSLTRLPRAGGYRGAGPPRHLPAGAPVSGGEDSNELSLLSWEFTCCDRWSRHLCLLSSLGRVRGRA
ncbi:hypothetical protein E2C01_017596 [Portunus trituberculatus]|uniref:Uncharacterized protein n=1 Tax=Portunus trituberculatus TaxID=210409 RepID=A0A5B7DU64_PORTR|nr:hypothetical protein [Portunus trituberculatus]